MLKLVAVAYSFNNIKKLSSCTVKKTRKKTNLEKTNYENYFSQRTFLEIPMKM